MALQSLPELLRLLAVLGAGGAAGLAQGPVASSGLPRRIRAVAA